MSTRGFLGTFFVAGCIFFLCTAYSAFAQMVSTSTFHVVAYIVGDEEDDTPGGGGEPVVVPTEIVFSGFAYPSSMVYLLKDGQLEDSVSANVTSDFIIPIDTIEAGTYLFSLYAVDTYGKQSNLVSYSIEVIDEAKTEVTGIILPPTVTTDSIEVQQGEALKIYGQAIQDSTVTLLIEGQSTTTVQAVSTGLYEYNLDTTEMDSGEYTAQARMNDSFVTSPFTNPITFSVTATPTEPEVFIVGDVNYDDAVDIIDFSIMAFWYEQELSEDFLIVEAERLSGDGVVNLIDFSLMAYYWTG